MEDKVMRLKRRNVIRKVTAMGVAATIIFTGCQKAPEDAVVKNKNLDKMIEQAKKTGDEKEPADIMAEKYTSYKNNFSNDKLGVTVEANAKVDIPKKKQMSVVRVKQKKIDQNFLDKVKKELNIQQTLYDGCVTNIKTKEEVEKEIQELKAWYAEIDKTGEDTEVYEEEYRASLSELEKEYKSAPDNVSWEQYKSNGKIEKVKDLYNRDKENTFYSWAYDLNKNGEIYYGVSDGKDGEHLALYVQNNENYGNVLRFFRSKNVVENDIYGAVVKGQEGCMDTNAGLWPADREPRQEDLGFDMPNQFYQYKNEENTLTEEMAKDIAEKFLKNVGLGDYQCDDKGFYCETFAPKGEKAGYRKVWILRYLRNINGVLVNNESGAKYSEDRKNNSFVKKMWSGESVEFCINNQGIVTFNYNSPNEITETVVENSNLKSFKQIKKIFENMVVTAYAQDQKEKEKITIKVNQVILRYMRISEANSFDTGLLVPVWEFIGTKSYSQKTKLNTDKEESILTVNAIDGTIIDKKVGY